MEYRGFEIKNKEQKEGAEYSVMIEGRKFAIGVKKDSNKKDRVKEYCIKAIKNRIDQYLDNREEFDKELNYNKSVCQKEK